MTIYKHIGPIYSDPLPSNNILFEKRKLEAMPKIKLDTKKKKFIKIREEFNKIRKEKKQQKYQRLNEDNEDDENEDDDILNLDEIGSELTEEEYDYSD